MWYFVAQAFSGPVVEAVLGQSYLIVSHFFQLAVLGEELADKAVEVFVGAAHPGGVRMGEVEVQLERTMPYANPAARAFTPRRSILPVPNTGSTSVWKNWFGFGFHRAGRSHFASFSSTGASFCSGSV